MPRSFITLADSNKLAIFKPGIGNDPDNVNDDVGIQETLRADIATYLATGENISCSNVKLLSLFNNSGQRMRIQRISVMPRTLANNVITLRIGYINASPTGGTDGIVSKYAVDYPPSGSTPAQLLSFVPVKLLPTAPNAAANVILGSDIVALNTGLKHQKQNLFSVDGNGSALILRNGLDGITIEQIAQTATGGSVTFGILFTLG